MYEVELSVFHDIVAAAIEDLPAEFGERINNVEFAVEDVARRDDLAPTGAPAGSVLLGVYRGVPLPKRHAGYNMALPDRIIIFQVPLQRLARDEADLRARVRHVVLHEIAHYFGISDDRLREIDAY
jgi:predicted Zn-dependent protease with MMP-like domain